MINRKNSLVSEAFRLLFGTIQNCFYLQGMLHQDDAKKKAKEIMILHIVGGLTRAEAKKAAAISVELALKIGMSPGFEFFYKRVLDYLSDPQTEQIKPVFT